LGNIADTVYDFNEGQYEKSAKAALGIEFPVGEDWWPDAKENWAQLNYQLIGGDLRKYVRDINSLTERAVTSGWSLSTLTEQIRSLDGKLSEGRARFVARDQIGKLNGEITQRRMESAGLSMYIWSTSGDERVRGYDGGIYPDAVPSHYLMDEKLCRWDDSGVYSEDGGKTWIDRPAGAVQLHPGQDYQCRCTALAYWQEIIGEVDQEIEQSEEMSEQAAQNIAAIPPALPKPKNQLEQRFGEKAADFIKTSMQYIDDVKPIPDSVYKELEQALKRLNKTPEQYIAEVNDFIANGKIVRHDKLVHFLEDDNISKFEKDPRIKTQFETGTSQGSLNHEDRNFWERKLSGNASNYGWKPSDSDKTDYGLVAKHRPVYGEVTTFHPFDGNARGQYGEIAFVLSDKVRERASFTLDNSSVEGIVSFKSDAHSIFSKPEVDARQNVDNFYIAQRKGSGAYVEAQVWGGIDLREGDVEAVVIDDAVFTSRKNDSAFNRFLKVFKDNHVPVVKGSEWGKSH
jgi:hypothetical protein